MPPNAPILTLLGPTASGKSSLALRYARERRTKGEIVEIVSLDSTQVYQGLDIGSAKPSSTERSDIPHHLIDLCPPTETYSVGRFFTDCQAVVSAITRCGHTPLLVGGTMMYFNALQQGLSHLPAADPALRSHINFEAQRHGWPSLHQHLATIDPITAQQIKPQDAQRIERALELWHLTGKTPSELRQQPGQAAFPLRTFALFPQSRDFLHQRIASRLETMWQQGLVAEVEQLRARYGNALNPTLPAMRSVGYRQVWDFLEGHGNAQTMRDHTLFATRQLAKRQLTWLRRLPVTTYLDPEDEVSCWQKLYAGLSGEEH